MFDVRRSTFDYDLRPKTSAVFAGGDESLHHLGALHARQGHLSVANVLAGQTRLVHLVQPEVEAGIVESRLGRARQEVDRAIGLAAIALEA